MTSVSPVVLDEGHQLVNQFSQLCGNLNPDGWTVRWGTVTATLMDLIIKLPKLLVFLWPSCPSVCRCSQLELRGYTLREVCLNIQRDGEPQDTPFSCRVGEIMVRQLCSMFCLYCTLLEARQKLVHLWTTKKLFSCSDSHNVLGSYTVYSASASTSADIVFWFIHWHSWTYTSAEIITTKNNNKKHFSSTNSHISNVFFAALSATS